MNLLLHGRALQARDVRVPVGRLCGPMYAQYKKIEHVPPGSALVMSTSGSQAHKAKPLVMVATRQQEAAGMMYDRSLPFVVNGKPYLPACRGVWFEVEGEGYAVHAWAHAAGVSYRMQKQMFASYQCTVWRGEVCGRAHTELIPKLTSKSHRITMATLMLRAGVPAEEVTALGPWEDEAMMRTYVRALGSFAEDRRNYTNAIYGAGITASQAARATGAPGL